MGVCEFDTCQTIYLLAVILHASQTGSVALGLLWDLPFVLVCMHLCVHVRKNESAIVCIHDFKVDREPTHSVNIPLVVQLRAFIVTINGH